MAQEKITLTLIVTGADAKVVENQVRHYAAALPGVSVMDKEEEGEQRSRSGRRS